MDCWSSGAQGVTTDTMRLACDYKNRESEI